MAEHKYAKLAQKLRVDIQTGVYTAGQRLPSENELAASTGYSRQTVRQAMAQLESDGLTERVQGSGTYVRAFAPRSEPTYNIAVVPTYIREYVFPAILHGIDHVLSRNNYTSMLVPTRNRVSNERKVLTDLLQKPIDGLIVEGTKTALPNPNLDLYKQFASLGVPVVFFNGYYPDLKDCIHVTANDYAGGRTLCNMLLQKGHRNIGGIFKSDDMQGLRRYAGYATALSEAELLVADEHVMWFTTENCNSMVDALTLQTLQGCTAAVCYNDEVAVQVQQKLKESGMEQDIELVSFDNSPYARLAGIVSLTLPVEQVGRMAAQKLLNILQHKTETSIELEWGEP